MNRNLLVLLAVFTLLTVGCSSGRTDENRPAAKKAPEQISSFEECAAAGYPVMRSLPPKCAVPGGRVFTKGKSEYFDTKQGKEGIENPQPEKAPGCKNLCGDGTCQQMVCMAVGCPCAETPVTCPDDCASPF